MELVEEYGMINLCNEACTVHEKPDRCSVLPADSTRAHLVTRVCTLGSILIRSIIDKDPLYRNRELHLYLLLRTSEPALDVVVTFRWEVMVASVVISDTRYPIRKEY